VIESSKLDDLRPRQSLRQDIQVALLSGVKPFHKMQNVAAANNKRQAGYGDGLESEIEGRSYHPDHSRLAAFIWMPSDDELSAYAIS